MGDIVDNRGVVLELKDIQKKFNFLNVNFLEYHHIKTLVNNFAKKHKNEDMFTYPQPFILKTVSDLHFNTTGTKAIHNKLNKVNIEKDFQRKWHQDIGITLDTTAWQQKFRICFKQFMILITSGFNTEFSTESWELKNHYTICKYLIHQTVYCVRVTKKL